MKNMSFKMRIAVFTGIIVLMTSLSLSALSMLNARNQISSAAKNSVLTPAVDGVIDDNAIVLDPDKESDAYTVIAVETAENAIRKFHFTSVLYTAVIAAAGMLFAYLFAGRALKPIRKLNDAIIDITDENLNQRLPKTHSNDEISGLTNSFNSMLDRLDESFTKQKRFSSNAAHELKTPVSIIKMSVQSLKRKKEPTQADYTEGLDIIERNSERLADIIDDLLTLTNDRNDLPTEAVSLNALLVCIVNDLLPQYRKRDIKIEYDFDDKECFVSCSETLSYRLFYNLVENAFKYNNIGGSILISIKETDGKYKISVKDNGIGIPDEQLELIWEAFYCVDQSHSRKYGGAGLGLSVVKEISGRFGWNVQVHSETGKGSEFIVEVISI